MTDVDEILRAELHRLVPVNATPDWEAVAARAGLQRERVRRRAAASATLVAAVAVLGLATPLGAAIAHGLDGFSAWLTGQPGTPASQDERRAFDRANARSWLGFPKGTQLRHLITQRIGGTRVELLGFRSGSSTLCLRLAVTGAEHASNVNCAPLADLELAGSPVRVLLVDQPVGTGTKRAWYGIDRLHSAKLQISAGVAADNVRTVVLRDEQGRHVVRARSNAFLYVAHNPEIAQRVSAVWARTASRLVAVPFSPSPLFGLGGGSAQPKAPPVRVERKVTGGRVGWLDQRAARGLPITTLPLRIRRGLIGGHLGRIIYGRVLTPDPSVPYRVAITLNAHRRGGPPGGVCTMLVGPSSAGGGCSPYPGVFDHSPISFGVSGDGPGEFMRVAGVVSDDVTRLQLLLANRQRVDVPLADNAFVVGVSRASVPARLVGYDTSGKVIAASDPIGDLMGGGGPNVAPARGRAVELLHVTGAGGEHAELLVGKGTNGGECMYVKHFVSKSVAGVMEGCHARAWTGPPVQLGPDLNFVSGRVRSDVAEVRLRFETGPTATLQPTRGYVLGVLPTGRRLVSVEGLARDGHVVGRQRFPPPVKRQ